MIALKYSIMVNRQSIHTVRSIIYAQLSSSWRSSSRSKQKIFWTCSNLSESKIESLSVRCENIFQSRSALCVGRTWMKVIPANSRAEKSHMVHQCQHKTNWAQESLSGICEHTSKMSWVRAWPWLVRERESGVNQPLGLIHTIRSITLHSRSSHGPVQ